MVGTSREVCAGTWHVRCLRRQTSKSSASHGDNIKFRITSEMIIGFNCRRKTVNGYYLRWIPDTTMIGGLNSIYAWGIEFSSRAKCDDSIENECIHSFVLLSLRQTQNIFKKTTKYVVVRISMDKILLILLKGLKNPAPWIFKNIQELAHQPNITQQCGEQEKALRRGSDVELLIDIVISFYTWLSFLLIRKS